MKRIIQYTLVWFLIPCLAFAQQNIDIGIFKSTTAGEVEIKLRPNFSITNNFLTNVQFTVRWDSSANVSVTPASIPPYLITPQGAAVYHNGYIYQIFASSSNAALNWNSGQEYMVLSFSYSDCVEFELVKDAWTQANNGDFYIELLGFDHTGVFYNLKTNILPKVNLGKDTIICVYNTLELNAGNPGASFLWSTGETTQKIQIDSAAHSPGSYLYSVVVTDQQGCSDSDSIFVSVDPCTGMNDNYQKRFRVFPNPSYGEIFIDTASKSGSFQINIFDICGTQIRDQKIIANNSEIQLLDLSALSPGIYLLTVSGGNVSFSEKIVLMN